jgi:hypothetical protein
MAMSILGIGVVAVSAALTAGSQQTAAVADVRLATELAEAMLEEILALPYDDPDGASALGPEGGESRLTFDNTDDFHGYTEADGSVAMADGTAYPAGYVRFARAVSISAVAMQPAGFPASVDGLQVTVTVTQEGNTLAVITRFVTEP